MKFLSQLTKIFGQSSVLVVALASLTLSGFTYASGSYGGGGGYSNSGSYQPKKVDQNYEYGKAIFQGRLPEVEKRDYCVNVDGEATPLKRKSVKAYKKGSINKFANALVDCNDPEQKIGNELSQDHFQFVIYYLNKRYSLKLKS